MPSRGLSLAFDPRYVEYAIQSWQVFNFGPVIPAELTSVTAARAVAELTRLNGIGLYPEKVNPRLVTSAISVLKSLKLAKLASTGPRGAKVSQLVVTPVGERLFREPLATANSRVDLICKIVANNTALAAFIRTLVEQGPLIQPVRHLNFGAPRQGKAYATAVEEGIRQFWALPTLADSTKYADTNPVAKGKKPTPAQLLSQAQRQAMQKQPAGSMQTIVSKADLLSDLGLIWSDTEQLNEVLAVRFIGAAVEPCDSAFAPNAPTWSEIGPQFLKSLLEAHSSRADSTGSITIDVLRGALGRELSLSPAVVDALICQVRDLGDQGLSPISLHFEPNDDLVYAKERKPLIWQGDAYDFVEVRGALHNDAPARIGQVSTHAGQ